MYHPVYVQAELTRNIDQNVELAFSSLVWGIPLIPNEKSVNGLLLLILASYVSCGLSECLNNMAIDTPELTISKISKTSQTAIIVFLWTKPSRLRMKAISLEKVYYSCFSEHESPDEIYLKRCYTFEKFTKLHWLEISIWKRIDIHRISHSKYVGLNINYREIVWTQKCNILVQLLGWFVTCCVGI